MDTENNFDSDTSESWSLIDLNCERSTDINLMDEIGAEALEARMEEVESVEKCSPLSGDKKENGSPGNIIVTGNNGNIAAGNGRPKNQPPVRVMFDGPMFEDDSDSELYATDGKMYLTQAEKTEPETKEVDEDTDGISVISESEVNDGKANTYESDETSEEKPSDNDANENPSSNNSKNGKAPNVSSGESSDDNVNSGIAPGESCSSTGTGEEKNENEKQRNQLVIPPVYRPNRNNRPGFAFRLTMALILSGISYIILGYFCGEQNSLRAVNNMAQTVRKLQKENLILHSRLTQLNRAVLARGLSKLDLKEENEPPCLKDEPDCRKINLKLYERKMDEGNYDFSHPRNKNSLDFSIPLNHPKNVLAFKQILVGNEVVLARKTDENFEPFNFSKYVEALVSGDSTVETPSAPLDIDKKPSKLVEVEDEIIVEAVDEEPDQKHEEPEGKDHEADDSTVQDEETHEGNRDDTQEKQLGLLEWFVLKDNPKCKEFEEVEDLDEVDPNCLDRVPMEIYSRTNLEAFEDLIAAAAATDFFEEKSDEIDPSKTASTSQDNPESTHDRDNLKEKEEKEPSEKDSQSEEMKKREINPTPEKRDLDDDPSSPKEKGKDEKENVEYKDKFLKYFAAVEEEFIKNNRRVKVCVRGKDGICEFKFPEPDEDNQAQSKKYKKNGGKRSKPDGKRKNNKKDQPPKRKRDKAELRSKKWSCRMKPDVKCGNNSKCDDCSCKSGNWFSKYTEGREKCRRDQKINDWLFDRAKSREYSRVGDASWQFSRANGRNSRRMSPFSRKKKAKHFRG